jgi:hypothetical protein
LYTSFCEVINEVTSPSQDIEADNQPKLKYFHTPLKYMIKEASGVCQRLNARLPEIRTKQPQMASRQTITENIANSLQILDIHHRLAEKTVANIQRFAQQNYPLIKPSNPNPFKKRPASPSSPPPGNISRTHN